MKKLFAFLLITVFLISGCSFDVQVMTPAPSQNTSEPITQVIASPVVAVSTVTPTPVVGFTPVTSDPVFYGAYTTADQSGAVVQSSFPVGTKEVFASWNYQNMRAGLTIKREWYLDGKLWLAREEPWDFAKYDASGIIPDIRIYDTEVGLPSGAYQLKVYIDGIQQPIGNSSATLNFLNFVIQTGEAYTSSTSPDFQWKAEIFGEKRIVIRDVNGTPTQLYTGQEIPYLIWFANNRNILFVDRDRSGVQQPGSLIGVRDNLWIADTQTGDYHLLYQSETAFTGRAGLILSPYEKHIASLAGSGFGDACSVDSKLLFFELANDRQSVKVIKQEQFSGIPTSNDGVVYPMEDGSWETDNLFHVTLNGTCSVDPNQMGPYVFNLSTLTATKSSATSVPPIPGDLGFGNITGKITNADTDLPIPNATVSCEHFSYTSKESDRCNRSTTTDQDGVFLFENVFFHDTDTIKLTVDAPGYQPKETTWASFTMPILKADIYLSYPP